MHSLDPLDSLIKKSICWGKSEETYDEPEGVELGDQGSVGTGENQGDEILMKEMHVEPDEFADTLNTVEENSPTVGQNNESSSIKTL